MYLSNASGVKDYLSVAVLSMAFKYKRDNSWLTWSYTKHITVPSYLINTEISLIHCTSIQDLLFTVNEMSYIRYIYHNY